MDVNRKAGKYSTWKISLITTTSKDTLRRLLIITHTCTIYVLYNHLIRALMSSTEHQLCVA